MWGFIISAISGLLMSVQGVFNTEVTKQTSIWLSAAFVQITAFIVCVLAWYIQGKTGNVSDLFKVQPKYMLLGGVFGAFITYTVIMGMRQLGPAKSVMIIVAAQILSAYIIELFGWFGVEKVPFQWSKLFAVLLFVISICLFKKN